MIEEGTVQVSIEDKIHKLKAGKIAVIFPEQVSLVSTISIDLKGKIILFEEILFCSDILKNELSTYNVHLSTQLNCIILSAIDFQYSIGMINTIQDIYQYPSLVKEQARFYIKILLLGLIESVHGLHPVLYQETVDKPIYIKYKKLLNIHYKQHRTVQYYAEQLMVSSKSLIQSPNAIVEKQQ